MSDKFYFSSRSEVPEADRWSLHQLYPDLELWRQDLQKVEKALPQITEFRGRLQDEETLFKCFQLLSDTGRILEKAYTFASHFQAEDLSNSEASNLVHQAQNAYVNYSSATSFISPELTALPETYLQQLIKSERFAEHRKELEFLLISKPHILSASEENILSQVGILASVPESIFSTLENVDLQFGEITDPEGQKQQLTSGNFITFLEHQSRPFRQAVFEQYYRSFQSHIHTFAETLNAQIRSHHVFSKIKKHSSCLAATLFRNQIDPKVYQSLIQSAHESLPDLYRYFEFRKEKLGLDHLKMWDLRVNLFDIPTLKFSYEQAVEICLEAVKPLGENYCRILAEGLKSGWVDKYENKGKRGGAFSGGSFDTPPFILLNFTGSLNDVYTLIHEAGHSMHSYFARSTQTYTNADYPIFTAEIASTVNERLLTDHLLKTYQGKERLAVLTYEIDAIRATFFRQTMYAEFELLIHQKIEQGDALTPDFLNQEFAKLNDLYYGEAIERDQFIQYEWARMPHLYYNFYVYQYATGMAAAYFLSRQILDDYQAGSKQAAERYISFLSSGGNDFPLRQLEQIGVNFTDSSLYLAIAQTLNKSLELISSNPKKI